MTVTMETLAAALSDRYRLDRELGAGGMATVYLAHDIRHQRPVAVKVLRPDLVASLGGERFLREIAVTASLQHPHILALYDSGQAGGLLYYVMPYVPGDSLRQRLEREGQLPVGDAVRIARGVASALAYAHRLGVVHRDIKPENILLAGGEALVADFGIARAIAAAGGDTLTGTGITLGTPTYMSPEQAGAERTLDGRSDVYSLGCVLYEMLAGDAPYGGATAQVITARKLSDPVPSLRAIRESVPAGLEAIIGRALAKAPADRFQSADELAAALDGVISAPHTATHAVPAAPDARERWAQRLWQGAAIVGVAAAAMLAWQVSRAPSAAFGNAVVQSTLILPDSSPMAFVGEAPLRVGRRSLALSPDGRTLVYAGWHRGRTHLFVRPLDDERVRRLEGTEGAYGPFFSPNGKWVAYFSGQTLSKVPLEGGTPVRLAAAPEAYGGVWLPDGRILFGAKEALEPMFVNENGGAASVPARLPISRTSWSASIGSEFVVGAIPGVTAWVASLSDEKSWGLTERGLEPHVLADLDHGLLAPAPAASPQLLSRDLLLVAGDGRLHAVRFDPRTLRGQGPAVPLDEMVRQEVFGQFAHFAVGGNGTLVYAPGENIERGVLVLADRRGTLDTLPFGRARYRNPRFSPDGRRVAVFVDIPSGTELQVLDLAEKTKLVAATTPPFTVNPIWSADGRFLMYLDSVTMQVRATGGTPEKRTDMNWLIALTRDGSFSLENDTASSFIRHSTGQIQRFTNWLTLPDISPDGRWVAWMDIGTKGYEAYVTALPPGGPVFSVSPDGCVEAYWMPDGRELVCYRTDGYLYSIPLRFEQGDVSGGPPRRIVDAPLLDSVNRSWTLSPDGQRMLFVAVPPSDSTTRLTVVTHFRERVERKLAEAQGRAQKR